MHLHEGFAIITVTSKLYSWWRFHLTFSTGMRIEAQISFNPADIIKKR